jgi:hypothetical protein
MHLVQQFGHLLHLIEDDRVLKNVLVLARSCSRSSDGLLENSKRRSVFRKSNTRLLGKADFKYVVFPVFLGPQKNADWCAGSSRLSILWISDITNGTP